MQHIFNFPEVETGHPESFETLYAGSGEFRLERIVSWGHVSADGEWYEQAGDEWVLVLEGEAGIGFSDGAEVRLRRGESLLLPRLTRHRVTYTSCPCIWLALHAAALKTGCERTGFGAEGQSSR
jgi:cupin 2 domain-containing protein